MGLKFRRKGASKKKGTRLLTARVDGKKKAILNSTKGSEGIGGLKIGGSSTPPRKEFGEKSPLSSRERPTFGREREKRNRSRLILFERSPGAENSQHEGKILRHTQ